MKPVIGVVGRVHKNEGYPSYFYIFEDIRQSIIDCGGEILPLIPPQNIDYYETRFRNYPSFTKEEEESILKWLKMCDGIVLPGGLKITNFDRYVLEFAVQNDIPILGICLGMQIMSCYKEDIDIIPIDDNHLDHRGKSPSGAKHLVKLQKDSIIYDILKTDEFMVNSFHTRCAQPNKYYETVAFSEDGIIEAIELKENTFNIGVQWHPERSYKEDIKSKLIFEAFIDACRK